MRASSAALIAIAVLVFAPSGSALQGLPTERLAWQLSRGPFTGNVRALVQSESGTVFALARAQLYRSVDDGVTWQRCESQPVHGSGVVHFDSWLAAVGARLYASGDPGGPIYASIDECKSSRAVPPPPGTGPAGSERITVANGILLATTGDNLFALREENFMLRGATGVWSQLAVPQGSDPRPYGRGEMMFLVAGQRLFRSPDRGTTWRRVGPEEMRFAALVTGGTSLYAAASGGVWRSADNGETWTRMLESGLTALTASGPSVHAAVFNPLAIMRSANDGVSWASHTAPNPHVSVTALLETRRGSLLAAARGIFRSVDDGKSWTLTGLSDQQVASLSAGRAATFASMADGTLWQSADAGLSWSHVPASTSQAGRQVPWSESFRQMLQTDNRILGATRRELFASLDGGITWATSGLSQNVTGFANVGATWFASTSAGVFRSEDLSRWTECSNGLSGQGVSSIIATPIGDLIAFQDVSTSRSTDGCRSWSPIVSGRAFPSRNGTGYAAPAKLVSDETLGVVLLGSGIAQLSVPERKWILRNEDSHISVSVRDSQGRYWLGTRAGVSRLYTNDSTWRIEGVGLQGPVSALAVDPGGYLLAAIEGRGVFRARLP